MLKKIELERTEIFELVSLLGERKRILLESIENDEANICLGKNKTFWEECCSLNKDEYTFCDNLIEKLMSEGE